MYQVWARFCESASLSRARAAFVPSCANIPVLDARAIYPPNGFPPIVAPGTLVFANAKPIYLAVARPRFLALFSQSGAALEAMAPINLIDNPLAYWLGYQLFTIKLRAQSPKWAFC